MISFSYRLKCNIHVDRLICMQKVIILMMDVKRHFGGVNVESDIQNFGKGPIRFSHNYGPV